MKKLLIILLSMLTITTTYGCMGPCIPNPPGRLCTYSCCLPEDYTWLKVEINAFRRHFGMNACAINDFARSIAPYFANRSSHDLSCIVAYVLTVEDQALRFAISKALSHKDAYRLNFFWHLHHNPEIIEQPYEDDFRIIYNGIQVLRQALHENNMRTQLAVIEKLGFYFENRTIDFIAPLMRVALTKEDDFFLEVMGMYLRPYERLNILVVWDILFYPVKTVYNLADEAEFKKQAQAAAKAEQPAEQPKEQSAPALTPIEQVVTQLEVPVAEQVQAPQVDVSAVQEEPEEQPQQVPESVVSPQPQSQQAYMLINDPIDTELLQHARQLAQRRADVAQREEPLEPIEQLSDTQELKAEEASGVA